MRRTNRTDKTAHQAPYLTLEEEKRAEPQNNYFAIRFFLRCASGVLERLPLYYAA